MVNKKDLIEIRKSLSKILFKFSEVVTEDGIVVVYDGELGEGVLVYTYDAEGAKVALPNGSYNLALENGKMVIVEVTEGKVVSVTDNMPVEESVNNEPVAVDMSAELTEMKSKYDSLESKISELVSAISKINEAVLSFGSQSADEPVKPIVINDTTSNKLAASKYFDNK